MYVLCIKTMNVLFRALVSFFEGKCLYRDSCDLQAWSAWDKPLNEEGCKMQTRTRSYVYPLKQAIQEDCNNLQTSCVTEPKEIRNYCK